MNTTNNEKKSKQLGMPIGTASNRLRKKILFWLLVKDDLNWCFHCHKEIESENKLSIEHKMAWLYSDNPKELFFDLNNIAFSHLRCNISNGKRVNKGQIAPHGTRS